MNSPVSKVRGKFTEVFGSTERIKNEEARLLAPNLNTTLPRQPLYLTLKEATTLDSPMLATKRGAGLTPLDTSFSGVRGSGCGLTTSSDQSGPSPSAGDPQPGRQRGEHPRPHPHWLQEAGSAYVWRKCSPSARPPAQDYQVGGAPGS